MSDTIRSIWGTCVKHNLSVEVKLDPDAARGESLNPDEWEHWYGLPCPVCGDDIEEGRD